jgi:hypothetical protein
MALIVAWIEPIGFKLLAMFDLNAAAFAWAPACGGAIPVDICPDGAACGDTPLSSAREFTCLYPAGTSNSSAGKDYFVTSEVIMPMLIVPPSGLGTVIVSWSG